ncbi:MAG: hypothetical protein IJC20_02000 [Clostridia bacterium]|nr:hypothetical protein [Clostridia bacterium]
MQNNNCVICNSPLTLDDVGATKKLINRGMQDNFLCIPCLAKKYNVTESRLREQIEYWRDSGCLLFVKN